MAHTTDGIISQPVSFSDVNAVLGTSHTDLATMCMDSHINMWSYHKPIYSTKITVLTENDWKGTTNTKAGYMTGGGILKIVKTGSQYISDIGTNGQVSDAVWTFFKPTQDGSCAFRLSDFDAYHHSAKAMFKIGTIFGNVSNIIIPSTQSEDGANYGFSMWFSVSSGDIDAAMLFGDCWTFYPSVIISSGGSDKLHFIKSADNPISSYTGSAANITVNSADFTNQIASDWQALHSGDPYSNFPLRTGDQWTATLVLTNRKFTGGDGNNHKLNTTSDKVVRLEYQSASGGTHVDRRTLPIKQSKYGNIEWMKMVVTITKMETKKYKISSINVTAKMLNTDSISFTVDAALSTPQGTVNVVNTTSGQSINVQQYSLVTFSGTTGEVTKALSFSETTYTVTATTVGNQKCNGTLTFKNSKGNFSGTFSLDISGGASSYSQTVNLM